MKGLALGTFVVPAAVVGVTVAGHGSLDPSGGLKPYDLQETLPQMLASFGSGARVVGFAAP